jgi:sec-independent protein translocase protein TatB
MFDIGWSELLVIAVVAIVVVGPKDLPRALRTVGQWTAKTKRMAREFQNQFNEALREAELDSVKKEVESISRIDPLADAKKDIDAINAGLRIEDKPATPAVDPAVAASVMTKPPAEIAPPPAVPPVEPAPSPEPLVVTPAAEPVAAAEALTPEPAAEAKA